MASGIGAGLGAEMLQEVLRRQLAESEMNRRTALDQQRMKIEQQRADDEKAYRGMQQQSLTDARAAAAQAQAGTTALRIASALKPQQRVSANTIATLDAGDAGDLVTDRGQTLDSTNLAGGASTTGAAPRILGLAASSNPGMAGTFTGTAAQQASEQARQDAIAAREEARKEREKAREQALADKKDMLDYANANRPPAQTHARYTTAPGTDGAGKSVIIRTNIDTGAVDVLPMPDGAHLSQRDRPATQDQTNLAIYGKRVQQSEPDLKALETSISKMNPVTFLAESKVDNPALQSAEFQKYAQASRNFISAVLRRESGAAISASEFDQARKQYLPMPGDTAQTLKMKADNRRLLFDEFKRGSGPAWQEPAASTAPGGGGSALDILNARRKGGQQ